MSDNWLMFIPVDPTAQPARVDSDRAVELLKRFAPDAGDEVRAVFHDKIEFHDCGSNWCGVKCPQCSEDIEEWWGDATGDAYESGFADLCVTMPCCEHSTTLNDLNYVWPAGFARFVLEAKNPNIRQTTAEQDRELAEALGMNVKKIWRHL
ncbi:MAG: hypothetical protein M0D54_13515 [Hyphomonadaceae bacterium JAD_PAG50586_4]|nr:MAG: hypothetical protein M0D54_13515 [Hyphomonadaceae bacterium JAD_PAG50586_4]